MGKVSELWRRVGMLARRGKFERELEEEMRLHRELKEKELIAGGVESQEARYAANRQFGNAMNLRERGTETWGWRWLQEGLRDVSFSLRIFVKSPGFSLTAILILAFGIGLTTAIFSVVNVVLLRPLPYKDPDRLVTVWGYDQPKGFDTDQVSYPDFIDWKNQNHVFESMAASTDAMYTMTGAGEPAAIIAYQFSPEYFDVMGVAPALGRTFLPDEIEPGKNHVVVLSNRLWKERFGGDRDIAGRSVKLDGNPYTVIGVMPPSFQYPSSTELWTPLTISPEYANDRGVRFLRIMARRKRGATLEQARTEMNTIASRLRSEYPNTNKDQDVNLIDLRTLTTGDIRPVLLVLLTAVSLVLLANLSIPQVEHIPVDGWVLSFALLASLITAVVFGLLPALEASRTSSNEFLKEGGRGETGGSQGRRLRSALVISEIALSLILLAAAGLMIKSFRYLISGDLGFRPDHVLSLRILLPDYKYKTDSQRLEFGNEVVARVGALPGVESVGTVTFLPLSGWWGIRQVSNARAEAPTPESPAAVWSSVTPAYFHALGIPLLEGRYFTPRDENGNAPVAILSAKLARRLWPNEDPIGKLVNVQGWSGPRQVAGVVGEIRNFGLASEQRPEIYVPFAQVPSALICVAIRTAREPASLAAAA